MEDRDNLKFKRGSKNVRTHKHSASILDRGIVSQVSCVHVRIGTSPKDPANDTRLGKCNRKGEYHGTQKAVSYLRYSQKGGEMSGWLAGGWWLVECRMVDLGARWMALGNPAKGVLCRGLWWDTGTTRIWRLLSAQGMSQHSLPMRDRSVHLCRV